MRPAADWIVKDDAWPALVEKEIFAQVQSRRAAAKEKFVHVRGKAVQSAHLLTGLFTCGVCGGRMFGATTTSGKGYRTRYYTCTTHHRGELERCPVRYSVPADKLEGYILDLVRADLLKLRDDEKLHEYVAEEMKRLTVNAGTAPRSYISGWRSWIRNLPGRGNTSRRSILTRRGPWGL